ncbi:MAG: hypothetical protein M3N32_09910 [Actinomycetota bacterium]|nr:hypothetical protein [Actinomycetota bacterium]
MRVLLPALIVLVAVVTSCTFRDAPPDPAAIPSAARDAVPEPRLVVLRSELDRARTTIGAAGSALEEARLAGDLGTARSAAERTVHTLSASAALGGDLDGDKDVAQAEVSPFFPAPDSRGGSDVLSRALAAARAAGEAGTRVSAVLEDPVAGDVTGWERRPDEQMALIRAATVDGEGTSIGELQGEATRALAWALLTVRARELEAAQVFAERGGAHLLVALTALEGVEVPKANHHSSPR